MNEIVKDEIGWLCEMQMNNAPHWFRLDQDDDWTNDASKALRLARKEDAEAVIAYFGWTEVVATEHMWIAP